MRDYSFGDFLRELRIRQGLSQHQLGALVGVTGKAVSKWENGTSKPHSRLLLTLGDALGVTVDELLAARHRSSDMEKGVFGTKKQLWNEAEKLLYEKYGEKPDIRVMNRWLSEFAVLENSDSIISFDLARKIRQELRSLGRYIRINGYMHSSFAAYIMGASDINPLPPHYYCPVCRKIEFSDDVQIGWDLPMKTCICGRVYERDGLDIPADSVRNLVRDGTLLFAAIPKELLGCVKKLTEEYFSGRIMVTFIRKDHPDFERVVFLPDDRFGMKHGDVMPIEDHLKFIWEYPAVSLILGDYMDRYSELERETNTSFDRIRFVSREVLGEFISKNTDGINELNGRFIHRVFDDTKPESFADLLKIMGLTHGTGMYIGNGENLIKAGMPLENVIAYREDIIGYIQKLINGMGMYDTGCAYRIMQESYRMRQPGISDKMRAYLSEIGCEPWFIESLDKIRFIMPKGGGAVHLREALILMWYKLNYPETFNKIMSVSKKSE